MGIVWILARYLRHHPTSDRHLGVAMIIDRSAILRRAHRLLFFRVRWRTAGIPSEPYETTPMKRFFALALATFLGLGLLSTSFAAFALDAYGGITNSRGGYGSTGGYQAYTR